MAGTRAPGEATLTGRAYAHIRDGVLSGRLQCGAPVSPRRLAEELGMSPVPVAEALVRLETEGVVERLPRAGTRVKIPTAAEIHGHYVVREALETHSARLFAELAGERDRRRLLSAGAALDAKYAALAGNWNRGTHARVERAHFELHMLITRATRCPELLNAIERSRVLLFNWLFSMASEFLVLPARWHTDLAEALAWRPPAEAAEAMRVHVRYRQEEVIEKFRRLTREAGAAGRGLVRGPQRRTVRKLQGVSG